jgi:hypothetical protein
MGRGGHGQGIGGASTDSHDAENPEDAWNLYQHIDQEEIAALNAEEGMTAMSVFKPHARMIETEPKLVSDADEELIIVVPFTSPVHIRRLCVIGSGEEGSHPNYLKCFVNMDGIDFNSAQDINPSQAFELPINTDGQVHMTTSIAKFTNVTRIAFYFTGNHGDEEQTGVQYIGMQGEHTHGQRRAVHTSYELIGVDEEGLSSKTTMQASIQ